ncbi:hypothetical protein [Sphingobium bisphenolivorans]|uniref:hypothetical protein n=1 Tax=Sphingobium bisphenolivorans TaxID=1335760 RepID=UPI00048244CB|nr:hypothetical protein [Sphingobium bisphenolivorans]
MMLALVAGCRLSSEEDSSAANQTAAVAAVPPAPALPEPPAEQPALPPARPSAEVTVRAHPAPLGSLDLPPSQDAAAATPFPDEVARYMVDRDSCDHFRGEEPYDAERRAFLEENIAELCIGTDAKLAMLRRRYAANGTVIAALRGYESRIEGE